ncbi:hypothetical protein ITX31_05940 [Arthrobacter gandavensis]|uniref:hypothetical protein n=1 Tax=Arthrobacter gandavensis TaxID=169960 RepID=UPI00188EA8A3|nr:hypothetical protein [Arthrobacter gandavensis]MBF4993648.1 hypothetical protein [Arthrobacter gandavensis]
MIDASLVVSVLALAFTIVSFYWLQARKGCLKLYPVSTFSGAAADPYFLLRLPIMIYNSGAKPRVVSGLRLRLQGEESALLECHTFRTGARPKSEDIEDFFHPYVVPGREVITKFAHFRGEGFSRLLTDVPSSFVVEVQHEGKSKWKALGELVVHTETMFTGNYISYSNNSGVWRAEQLDEAKKWRKKLAEEREPTKHEEEEGRGTS